MNRRGFIGAMSGLPIAAVVQPRVAAPEVVTPALPVVGDLPQQPRVNITINVPRPLTARDRDELARAIGDGLTRQLQAGRRFRT